jgi:NAD+ kinase
MAAAGFNIVLGPPQRNFSRRAWKLGCNRSFSHGGGSVAGLRRVELGSFGSPPKMRWQVDAMDEMVSAEWTPSLSIEEVVQLQAQEEESRLFRNGPPPGDLAEVEAYCRIHRLAEVLHAAVMTSLRTLSMAQAGYANDRDHPVLEEKVVAGLARIGAVLQQGRLEVVGSRNLVNLVNTEEQVPPLARMRAELKEACESLQKALETCLYPALIPETIYRPLQRLHNICLDAGFPRFPGSPSHADIPNLASVKLCPFRSGSNLDGDDEIAFWRGGQVTEEGVEWLLKEGFKVVVDMRAEQSGSPFAQTMLETAEKMKKLRIIKMPVPFRTAPTAEQVEEFAKLVADPENKPLYLHSQGGVGRACAMVSRWREYVLQRNGEGTLSVETCLSPSNSPSEEKMSDNGGAAVFSAVDGYASDTSSSRFSSGADEKDIADVEVDSSRFSSGADEKDIADVGVDSSSGDDAQPMIRAVGSSFEAQRPGPDVFSKNSMSKFMRRPKTIPQEAGPKLGKDSLARSTKRRDRIGVIAGPAGQWGLADVGAAPKPSSSGRTAVQENGSFNSEQQTDRAGDGDDTTRNGSTNGSVINGEAVEQPADGRNGALFRVDPAEDNSPPEVEGDMCASTTGVVRVQSRRKAEMYLVRTDGFSCTRERVKESTLAFTHPSTQQQMLMWKTPPKTVLLLKKLGDELMDQAQVVASYLFHQEGMNVMVEPDVHDVFARLPGYGFVQTFYNQDLSDLHEMVDFVVCLGGDGVILHASNLFREAIPPVISFNLGSLGFLTAHPFEDFKLDLKSIIHGSGVYITLRMRLRCELFRNGKPIPGKVFEVLNEVVVDRGSNPYLCKIECYERSRLITKVQADGVIVATPTGSTAYSTAAGGSMVHPNVPCMLFTPICPHSLSFRPVILPDSALLELKVPDEARSNAWVSFDGKKRQQLCKGESMRISMSEFPMPTVNKHDQTEDWFGSLSRCFGWNQRIEQRSTSSYYQ